MTQYLCGIKTVADELAIIHYQVDDDVPVIHTLNGLGSEYCEVSAALRARENLISFHELHDMLTDYEAYLNRHTANTASSVIATANATQKSRQPTGKYKQQSHFQNQQIFSPN